MSIYSVLPFAQRLEGEAEKLYVGVMPADELAERAKIPTFNATKDTGYQRPVHSSRIAKIALYVLKKGGLLPTAVLVNVRENYSFEPNGDDTAKLQISDNEPLYVVDGQHRIEGMKAAKQRQQGPLPYDLPVVFALGLPEDKEAQLFYVVNHEARSVSTDLTMEILRRRVSGELETGSTKVTITERRKAIAAEIVRDLAAQTGIWHDRIQLADEITPRVHPKPVRFAAFVGTIEPFLRGEWGEGRVIARDVATLTKVLQSFWQGLAEISTMAPAFKDPELYTVQGPVGSYVWNRILCDVARRADKADDWSPTFFGARIGELVPAPWTDAEAWHGERGEPLARARGGGAGRLILEQILPHTIETPGLPDSPSVSAPAV